MSNRVIWFYYRSFNLPDKNFLNGAVKGNGKTLGLTNGVSLEGLGFSSDGIVIHRSGNYGVNVGLTNSGSGATNNSAGVTTDPTKSGIICDNDLNIKYIIKY